MSDLRGKVAVITGAATGIGSATAIEFARAGADVVVVDLAVVERGAATMSAIAAFGHRSAYVQADLSTADGCRDAVRKSVAEMGRMDVLVNVAGGARLNQRAQAPMAYSAFLDVTERDYDEIVDTNLKSAFFCSQAAAAVMLEQGGGKIINFGSEQAYSGFPLLAHYASAKAGVIALTKTLAQALAPTITVNTVCPGPIATESMRSGMEYTDEVREQIPLKRWGTPEEVGRSVLFLASSDGDFYTGQTLDPNGGTYMP